MAQGDVPTSPGGPLRRRREKRQLEQLAGEAARREPSPIAARKHVSVIEDQSAFKDLETDRQAPDAPSAPMRDMRPKAFHVHAVPIDQPIHTALAPSSETTGEDNGTTL
jgi:hypothetical protein